MPPLTSINDVDLRPIPGKSYFNLTREWREEFIYFLLVDRFADSAARTAVSKPGRSSGFAAGGAFYGGTLKGIERNLGYIAGLGCTAIWISPPFENNGDSYHGYDINNYLEIDPRFGTKQDLVDLVQAAHDFKRGGEPFPMRVILDVVINHSGDNWSYPGGFQFQYNGDERFAFGSFRRADRPVPTELRNQELYHRRGSISANGYDTYPENQHGDLFTLKDYDHDDHELGSELINVLIKAHCYWIREADVDGFRVDAVKHMNELACSRFCSGIREYAYSLGKRGFFLFGELASPDDELINRYIGQNTSRLDGNKTVFFGLDSILDFRLAEGKAGSPPLRDVIKAFAGPQTLFDRIEAQRNRALNRGEVGRYLVSFLDNHDSFWQPAGRFGAGAPDDQIIGGVGYLLCALGTPCLYYGTEQGFAGAGGDEGIREAMFDNAPGGGSLLNTACRIYQEIAKIAAVVRKQEPLRFGRMYFREISGNGVDFGLPFGTAYTLAFSRMLYGSEVLVAYNVSDQPRSDRVVVDGDLHGAGDKLGFLYRTAGASTSNGKVTVATAPNGTRFVELPLGPRELAVLR